jgi:hypothetical protein
MRQRMTEDGEVRPEGGIYGLYLNISTNWMNARNKFGYTKLSGIDGYVWRNLEANDFSIFAPEIKMGGNSGAQI